MTFRLALGAALVVLLAACTGEEETIGGDFEAVERVPYDVVFEPATGDELPDGLAGYLRSVSDANAATERPPTSLIVLRRRAEDDLPRLRQGLRAQGYYEGGVDYAIRRERAAGDEEDENVVESVGEEIQDLIEGAPTKLVYAVTPGPRFTFDERKIEIVGDPNGFRRPNIAGQLELRQGEPALAQEVLDAETELLRRAKNQGHPFAAIEPRQVIVDYDNRAMDVTLRVKPGPVVPIARPTIKGDEKLSEAFLRARTDLKAGQTYSAGAIDAARQSLIDTNLFSVVRVSTGEAVDDQGRLPVTVDLEQRKHRTIGLGVGYYTDEGLLARVFWEHRNLLHAGEQLRFEAKVSQLEQEASVRFVKPDIFLVRNLNLLANAALTFEDTDAYQSRSIGAGAGFERVFDRHTTGSLGVAYRYVEIEKATVGEGTFGLFSVPATLRFDHSDSLLDPSKGWRLNLLATPFFDTLNPDTQFLKTRATATAYLRLMNEPRLVLAFRGSIGSIAGADLDEVPADERFYAGGGGSVRGIPYQLAGPLNGNDPLGGLSVIEGGVEARIMPIENVEFAAFIDGGSAYADTNPKPTDARFGAGLGLRYITPVGPIRFDVAVPLNKRSGIDDAFQFYISIGQAF